MSVLTHKQILLLPPAFLHLIGPPWDTNLLQLRWSSGSFNDRTSCRFLGEGGANARSFNLLAAYSTCVRIPTTEAVNEVITHGCTFYSFYFLIIILNIDLILFKVSTRPFISYRNLPTLLSQLWIQPASRKSNHSSLKTNHIPSTQSLKEHISAIGNSLPWLQVYKGDATPKGKVLEHGTRGTRERGKAKVQKRCEKAIYSVYSALNMSVLKARRFMKYSGSKVNCELRS